MIVANTSIIVGRKEYQKGQAVSGLSDLDKNWMLEAGYISERKDATKGDSKSSQRSGGESLVNVTSDGK